MATTPIEVLAVDGSKIVEQGQLLFTGTLGLPALVDGAALPTVDPAIAGRLWSDSGVLTVSAG